MGQRLPVRRRGVPQHLFRHGIHPGGPLLRGPVLEKRHAGIAMALLVGLNGIPMGSHEAVAGSPLGLVPITPELGQLLGQIEIVRILGRQAVAQGLVLRPPLLRHRLHAGDPGPPVFFPHEGKDLLQHLGSPWDRAIPLAGRRRQR